MSFKLIDSGAADAQTNMRLDEKLLQELAKEPVCMLHFYDWKAPSATYGHFNTSCSLLCKAAVAKYDLQLAKRPTGGGLIFHQYDFAFSLLLSAAHSHYSHNTLKSYAMINCVVAEAICNALKLDTLPELHIEQTTFAGQFCMVQPTVYDLVLKGRKVAGAAQRRTRLGLLHQGSIALHLPAEQFLKEILTGHPDIIQAMHSNTYALLGSSQDQEILQNTRKALKHELLKAFQRWCA